MTLIPLLIGWLLDRIFGDPERLPHPIVAFGRLIAAGERRLNHGRWLRIKGAFLAIALVLVTYAFTFGALIATSLIGTWAVVAVESILIFYFLAGTTLIKEVRAVFYALDRSLTEGQQQVARIVGRDTSELTADEVRKAALETLAENLSDGVVAPLFWLALLGVPGMAAYKMINTLDSMIGYRTKRFIRFGTVAARLDDAANYVPARLTAVLMTIAAGRPTLIKFVARNGRKHASPNSGYPESALAGILGCRFGGGHYYFGEYFDKPYIGDIDRPLSTPDMVRAISINRRTEFMMLAITAVCMLVRPF